MRTGALDLAFTQFNGITPPGVTAWMLACEPLAVACAADHPLAGQLNVRLRDLADETFVDLQADWGTRQLIDQGFTEARLTRRTGFEVNDLPMQRELVRQGLGIALMPRAVIHQPGQDQAKPCLWSAELADDQEICWELAVVFAHDELLEPVGAVSRMFLGFLRESVEVLDDIAA